jgi:hypothetical protein
VGLAPDTGAALDVRLSGWRLLSGTGAVLDRALQKIHGASERRWCVLVEGSARDVDYLHGVSAPSRTLELPAPRRGGAALALELPGDTQLAGLLAAASTTAVVIRAVPSSTQGAAGLDELAADPDAVVAAATVAVRRDLGEPPMLHLAG